MRDGHVKVLPLHVANKIAAGEVVERPASVVKELVENAIDADSHSIRISIAQGGRKLISVQDDGCGMTRDDAVLSLERQATSKITDVDDIEHIDTLGFRGEAIPSIASVSRFSIITRRAESDEGTRLIVNAGVLADVKAAGCPPGTLVEVRDLFCNVPARKKFLKSCATEESHIKEIFTLHALAHPQIAFSLIIDGREIHHLAAADNLSDRVREIFGTDFLDNMVPIPKCNESYRVSGFIEKPNLYTPTRHEQYIFINGRPASAPVISYALREAFPRHPGDSKPAAILMLEIPPTEVDVNVHPTKREVRFRNTANVKQAIIKAIAAALSVKTASVISEALSATITAPTPAPKTFTYNKQEIEPAPPFFNTSAQIPEPAPIQAEIKLEVSADGRGSKPWKWFKFLAQTDSGYLIIETDDGVVTINPIAARERIAYEKLMDTTEENSLKPISQTLLIPETIKLSPVDFARLSASIGIVRQMGFQLEDFSNNIFKVEAVPQLIESLSPDGILSTIAHDLAETGAKKGARWREEIIAKSIARSFAGASVRLTEDGATKLVEDLSSTRMPYVCPRGKPTMIFTSNRELVRKFGG